jgi:hypothetical protein
MTVTHTLPKIESIQLIGRRWFRKSAGHTLTTVVICVNGEQVTKIGPTCGYGDYFEQMAVEWLVENGYLPLEKRAMGGYEPLWQAAKRLGFTLSRDVFDVARERDL